LALAAEQGFEVVAVSFDYGQRHAVELECARKVAAHYGVRTHYEVPVGLFREIGGSALTDDALEVPKDALSDQIPVTYVPARNFVFLSHAVGVAEVVGATDIFIGVNALDYSGYPDCRPEFIAAVEQAARLATKAGVEGRGLIIQAPLMQWTKAEIIRQGMALNTPYHLTHSCYDPTPAGISCGRCDSCLLRIRGFEEAGAQDPIEYAVAVDWA
jgi:7-cyano-7-deazaguanine synthase